MARRTLLLIASILTAALGTALIWLYVQGAEARVTPNFGPALYLTRDVKAGESPVGAVVIRSVPTEVASGAVTSAAELGNLKLRIPAVTGQMLLRTMLGTSAVDTARFPKGGAVAVTINDPNRVPADLRKGDTVDVVELTKDNAGILLSNVTVRTIGQTGADTTATPAAGGATQNGAIPATIVGLDVGQDDAVKLYTVVAQGGQMALYLHNPKGS